MKKFGFTLAELFVAMAVIGVIATITLTSMHRIMPDKEKGMVLKAYSTILSINKDILEDPSLYMIETQIPSTSINCSHILACTAQPLSPQYNSTYTGSHKYPKLLKERMVIAQDFDQTNPYKFITPDGMEYRLAVQNPGTDNLNYNLTLDTRNTKRQDCSYSSSCQNPRLFVFNINSDGFIVPTDNLSRAYLMNPSDLADREADLQKASEL